MDQQIAEIYAERVFVRVRRDARYARVVQYIQGAASQVHLRADAVYFLANNISDMVIEPMAAARERRLRLETTNLISEEELFSALKNDLLLIIETAMSVAGERERQEISSASIIVAVGRVIDRLQVNSTKLWGR